MWRLVWLTIFQSIVRLYGNHPRIVALMTKIFIDASPCIILFMMHATALYLATIVTFWVNAFENVIAWNDAVKKDRILAALNSIMIC